ATISHQNNDILVSFLPYHRHQPLCAELRRKRPRREQGQTAYFRRRSRPFHVILSSITGKSEVPSLLALVSDRLSVLIKLQ
ncbi:hypothetical protein PanWU01x14_118110, partial [Parasponia andersonii]